MQRRDCPHIEILLELVYQLEPPIVLDKIFSCRKRVI